MTPKPPSILAPNLPGKLYDWRTTSTPAYSGRRFLPSELDLPRRLPMRKRRPLSCGLRRSNASRANRIWPAWHQRIASYRLTPVERVAGQIGQTQKATCEVGGVINGLRPRAGPGFRSVCDAVRCLIGVGVNRIRLPEPCVDNFLRLWLSLASLPELTQIGSLDFEQAGFRRFPAWSVANQPPVLGNKLVAIRDGFDLAMPNRSLFSTRFQHAAIHGFVLEVLGAPAILPPW